MAWATGTSPRKQELPADWPAIRHAVLERDQWTCTLHLDRCTTTAEQVDHIDDRSDHSTCNLRAVCRACHAARTATQGHDAMRHRRAAARHPVEQHPAHQRRR